MFLPWVHLCFLLQEPVAQLFFQQFCTAQNYRHTGAGLRGGADEIQIVEYLAPEAGPEPQDLEQRVGQPQNGPLPQVELALPGPRVIDHLVDDHAAEVGDTQPPLQGVDHLVPGPPHQRVVVHVGPAGHVAHRHQDHDRVPAVRRRGRVHAAGHVHVERRLVGQRVPVEYLIEAPAVVAGQEHVVRPQLRHDRAHGPVERDGRRRVPLAAQRRGVRRPRQQPVVRVDEVRVADHHVAGRRGPVAQPHAPGRPVAVHRYLLHVAAVVELGAVPYRDALHALQHLVETAPRVPDPFGQLGVLQQVVRGQPVVRRHSAKSLCSRYVGGVAEKKAKRSRKAEPERMDRR